MIKIQIGGKGISVLIITLLLSACNSESGKHFSNYLNSIKSRPSQAIRLGSDFNLSDPFDSLDSSSKRSPFQYHSLANNGVFTAGENNSFQSLPLNSLVLVGSLQANSKSWALVSLSNKQVRVIKLGDVIGNQHGKVIKIDGNSLQLEEMRQEKGKLTKRLIKIRLKTSQ